MVNRGKRRLRRAQATIEFAFVAPLFLLVFLGCVDAALWGVETTATVAAADQAARVAASSVGGPAGFESGGKIIAVQPTSYQVYLAVRGQVEAALFGTRLQAWCDPNTCAAVNPNGTPFTQVSPYATCPTDPATVANQFGKGVVAICAQTICPTTTCQPSGQACPTPSGPCDPPSVEVKVIGYFSSLVPPAFNLGWKTGEIPVDIGVVTHEFRFAK